MEGESILETINRLERQILVHSCIYYKMDASIWTDSDFDKVAYKLKSLINNNPTIAESAEWHEVFKGWDGTTGYHLPLDNTWVRGQAEFILKYEKGELKCQTSQQDISATTKKVRSVKSLDLKEQQTVEQQTTKKVTHQINIFSMNSKR